MQTTETHEQRLNDALALDAELGTEAVERAMVQATGRYHVLTIGSSGTVIDARAYADRGFAMVGLAAAEQEYRRWASDLEARLAQSLRSNVLDLDDEDFTDATPNLAGAPLYRYQLEPCTDGELCIACDEAGLIEIPNAV